MATQVKDRNPRSILKPEELQRMIETQVKDIQVRWNPTIERWQVYQVQTSPILQLDGNPRVKGIIMWTIEEENGDYRPPMYMDYERVLRTIANYKLLMKVGAEKYADMLDKRDIKRENAINPDVDDRLKQGAKELANVLYKKQTHHGNRATRRRMKS